MWADILKQVCRLDHGEIDVTHALPPAYDAVAKIMVYCGQLSGIATYKLVVIVNRRHPLFFPDDVRNNPGFSWHLDIPSDLRKRIVSITPLHVQDDPSDPDDMHMWITASTFKLEDVEPIMEQLWAFCASPKKKDVKLASVKDVYRGFRATPREMPKEDAPSDYSIDGQLVFCVNHIVFKVDGLEDSFYPSVIANIASQRITSCFNGSVFMRMTPELWDAIRNGHFKFVVMEPDLDALYGRYMMASYTQLIPR